MEKNILAGKTALPSSMLPGALPMLRASTLWALRWSGQNQSLQYLMHFRYYASSMGRFLKPDNIITNIANPQSWNLYSYVNNTPINFNDPTGHYGNFPGSTSPTYFSNFSSASWMNWGAYANFLSGLYGGNVAFGGGGLGGGGGSSKTYTYNIEKWILSGFFDMWVTEDQSPYEMTTYPTQAIWTYESYTVQGEMQVESGGLIKGERIPNDILRKTKIVGYLGTWEMAGILAKSKSPQGWKYQWQLISLYTVFAIGNSSVEYVASESLMFPQVTTSYVDYRNRISATIFLDPFKYMPGLSQSYGKTISDHSIYLGKKQEFLIQLSKIMR